MQRYFVSEENSKLILRESDFHHIKNVMRIRNNEHIICVLNNKSFECEFTYVNDGYNIQVLKEVSKDNELAKDVILYQALIKNDKFDLVVQKAVELGVHVIVPTNMKRSIIKIDKKDFEHKLDRYQKIIKEASEQSERQILPSITNYINLNEITLDNNTLGLIAFERDNNVKSLVDALKEIDKYEKVAIVIGPEGGFDPSEVDLLVKKGFKMVSLGSRILRSETASMFALSVVSHYIEGR